MKLTHVYEDYARIMLQRRCYAKKEEILSYGETQEEEVAQAKHSTYFGKFEDEQNPLCSCGVDSEEI